MGPPGPPGRSRRTIPAVAYLGVACGVGNADDALGAVAILAINVGLVLASATATLAPQRPAAQPRG